MPGQTRIHFVRHAQTLFNTTDQMQGWCDSPLTPHGERQAAALGEWMREVPLAAVFTSDLPRTRTTTAAALAGHPDLEPVPLTDLREWHFGGLEGRSSSGAWASVLDRAGHGHLPVEEGLAAMVELGYDEMIDGLAAIDPLGRAETAADVHRRARAALDVVFPVAAELDRTDGGDVLVVTHGAFVGTLLRHAVPAHRMTPGFGNCGIVTVSGVGDPREVLGVDHSCGLTDPMPEAVS